MVVSNDVLLAGTLAIALAFALGCKHICIKVFESWNSTSKPVKPIEIRTYLPQIHEEEYLSKFQYRAWPQNVCKHNIWILD
jgi:hypothetical protein